MPLPTTTASRCRRAQMRAKLVELDERWGDVAYWQAIAKNARAGLAVYLLASLDLKQDALRRDRCAIEPDQRDLSAASSCARS